MSSAPPDAEARRAVAPVICYPETLLEPPPMALYRWARSHAALIETLRVPPRDARAFQVPRGGFFRISSVDGPQVGDLNLFAASNHDERFYSGKTRALHGTHISVGDRMWSSLPYLRPMATIIEDTLAWYGADAFGGRVHDVIGTRCDPYTHHLLTSLEYHYCCHSNLTRALAEARDASAKDVEGLVHDVLNVFMCTGFTHDTGQYFMKASPVRPGDYIEFFAEIPLLGVLSACPGGDCSATHSSDAAACFPLQVDVFETPQEALGDWREPSVNGYSRSHGIGT
ncbi:MAG: DUF1989 domain-containing protein [Pseudomonadota bacterium]